MVDQGTGSPPDLSQSSMNVCYGARQIFTWRLTRRELVLVALFALCYGYFFPRYADWSQNSRLALVFAIVREGRLSIDTYASMTGDYAEFEGHRYTDKAPGPSLLAVPFFAIVEPILDSGPTALLMDKMAKGESLRATLKTQDAAHERMKWALGSVVATWSVVLVPAVVLIVVMYRLLGSLGASERERLLVIIAYGLATSAFPYAGNFYSHQLAASLLFVAFVLLWDGSSRKSWTRQRSRLAMVGLLLALSLISEYPSALIVGAVGLYALWHLRGDVRGVGWMAVGGLPPLLVMGLYNLVIFHSPLPVGYSYSALWQEEHQAGFYSLLYPQPRIMWELAFGSFRGLFFMSPILLIGIAGLWHFARMPEYRAEWLVCLWSVGSFFLFNASSVMWHGGFAVGPRYLVPMLPFLALPIYFSLRQHRDFRLRHILVAALLAWSLIVTWSLTIAGQAFPDYEPSPLTRRALSSLAAGDVARNWGTLIGLPGLWSLLPLAVVGMVLLLALRAGARPPVHTVVGGESPASVAVSTGQP